MSKNTGRTSPAGLGAPGVAWAHSAGRVCTHEPPGFTGCLQELRFSAGGWTGKHFWVLSSSKAQQIVTIFGLDLVS